MQVLGQHVEVGDVITFPARKRGASSYVARVSRVNGMRAYAADGNHRVLPYDDHVAVYLPGSRGYADLVG